jgi:hypothetical protein
MTVLKFASPKNLPAHWQGADLQRLLEGCTESLSSGEATGWAIGKTDAGDPQLYLLGPAPAYDCILSVSRLGRLYVLEDGNGKVLFESRSLGLLAQHARASLFKGKMMVLAQIAGLCATFRHTFKEKIEPILAEPIEVAAHLAPQLVPFV